MREILFKAKRIDNGDWVQGYYMPRPNSPGRQRYYIVLVGEARWYEIDLKTICQYTGLKDENGKRIWENDIVSFVDFTSTESGYCERNCIGRVAWDCECACFRVSGTLSAESYEVLQDCVIIGNVFDNPELLGQDGG